MTREEVVQAALTVERWCREKRTFVEKCDCPFGYDAFEDCQLCFLFDRFEPGNWGLEEFLRTRGMRDADAR